MFEKKIVFYEFGGFFKMVKKCPNETKSHTFAHRNIFFGIFAPGAVPDSSALCLFTSVLPMFYQCFNSVLPFFTS